MMFTNAEYIRPGQNNSGGEIGEIARPGVTQTSTQPLCRLMAR